MKQALQIFGQMDLFDSSNAISSPASAAGVTPSDSQDGPMTDPSGPAPVPASPSPRRGSRQARQAPVISGPHGSGSSASAALQLSLVNRLRQRLDTAGSTLFVLTWKQKTTPSGRLYCQLVASGTAHPAAVVVGGRVRACRTGLMADHRRAATGCQQRRVWRVG